jgi:N-acetylglucosamine-6-phosphate deacetylase
LLEDYAIADVDNDVVITHTDTGYNNAQRALQWLKHFNSHSFNASDSFQRSYD